MTIISELRCCTNWLILIWDFIIISFCLELFLRRSLPVLSTEYFSQGNRILSLEFGSVLDRWQILCNHQKQLQQNHFLQAWHFGQVGFCSYYVFCSRKNRWIGQCFIVMSILHLKSISLLQLVRFYSTFFYNMCQEQMWCFKEPIILSYQCAEISTINSKYYYWHN